MFKKTIVFLPEGLKIKLQKKSLEDKIPEGMIIKKLLTAYLAGKISMPELTLQEIKSITRYQKREC